jgi:hypothetical protein
MRTSLKSVLMCSAVLAAAGLALGQQNTDPKKPAPTPSNTAPTPKPTTAPTPPAKPGEAKPAAPGNDPMMEAWVKANQPGEMHKKLEPMVGTFDVVSKFSMGPGAPEMTSKGSAVNTWTMDGRFVQMTYQGDMMGMPFKGTGFMGFNNVSKAYESYWIDSMSTGMMMSTGKVSDDGKTFTWTGEFDDPMTGKKKQSRSVNRIVDANTYVFEMFETGPDGKEVRSGELTFTRSGAAKPAAKPEAKPATGNTAPAKPK